MSKVLIGSISSLRSGLLQLARRRSAGCRRRSGAASSSVDARRHLAGQAVELLARRARSRSRSPAPTPSRNSSTRSGRQAMPRSPASQSPAGRLCSTELQAVARRAARLISAASIRVGEQELDAPRSRLWRRARSGRGTATSLNSIVRLAANLRHVRLPCRAMLSRSRRDRLSARRAVARSSELLELVDLVDLGAHRDVGHALEDDLDHHRHLVLAPSMRSACAIAGCDLLRVGARGSPCSPGPRPPRRGRRRSRSSSGALMFVERRAARSSPCRSRAAPGGSARGSELLTTTCTYGSLNCAPTASSSIMNWKS